MSFSLNLEEEKFLLGEFFFGFPCAQHSSVGQTFDPLLEQHFFNKLNSLFVFGPGGSCCVFLYL